MFQYLWLYDFLGLLLARFIFAVALILEAFRLQKRNKAMLSLNIILGVLFFVGFLSSLSAIVLILMEIILMLKERKIIERNLLKIAFALIILFIGPGLLSADRIFNLRF